MHSSASGFFVLENAQIFQPHAGYANCSNPWANWEDGSLTIRFLPLAHAPVCMQIFMHKVGSVLIFTHYFCAASSGPCLWLLALFAG